MAPDHKRFFAPALGCAAVFVLFAWICAQFYLPGKGFTYLIEFGQAENSRYLPELRAVNHYELKDAAGYDAQYYAQIAMHPQLRDPVLRGAVDSLPYRARRILLCWIAYALAGGVPLRALHVYAVENLFCWFALGLLLWRWLPPTRWNHFLRWAAILFGFGLCCSVRGALVDGPSLLLIAAAVALVEARRLWSAALVLGAAGLAKETNLLAVVLFLPEALLAVRRDGAGRAERRPRWLEPKPWLKAAGLAAVSAAPLALWLWVLQRRLGDAGDIGARNFALPFTGYFGKWAEIWRHYRAHGADLVTRGDVLVLVALSVQWLVIVCRPKPSQGWWRVAAAYAVLAVFLGPAVWEGYPGAAARVLLPLAAAFNLLLPLAWNRPGWLALFLVGNLSVAVSSDVLTPPGRESYVVRGPRDLRIVPNTGQIVDAAFDGNWYDPEKSWLEYWRWCKGSGTVRLENPHPFPVVADVSFGLRANDARIVAVEAGDATLWMGKLAPGRLRPVELKDITLPPGGTVWRFTSFSPPIPASATDPRELSFSLRNLRLTLHPR